MLSCSVCQLYYYMNAVYLKLFLTGQQRYVVEIMVPQTLTTTTLLVRLTGQFLYMVGLVRVHYTCPKPVVLGYWEFTYPRVTKILRTKITPQLPLFQGSVYILLNTCKPLLLASLRVFRTSMVQYPHSVV